MPNPELYNMLNKIFKNHNFNKKKQYITALFNFKYKN